VLIARGYPPIGATAEPSVDKTIQAAPTATVTTLAAQSSGRGEATTAIRAAAHEPRTRPSRTVLAAAHWVPDS
jgi:hypothetical protein